MIAIFLLNRRIWRYRRENRSAVPFSKLLHPEIKVEILIK
jgi:hypothetical protein